MKPLTATLVLIFSILYSSAQISSPVNNYNNMSATDWNNVFSGIQPLVTQSDQKVKGTPFLYEQYLPGSIYLSDSIHSPDKYNFKLNIQTNEIWMLNEEGQEIILTSPRIMALVLTKDGFKHTFKKLPLPYATTTDRKFVEIFYCGSITLIKEFQSVSIAYKFPDQGAAVLNNETNTGGYEPNIRYYLTDETGKIQKLGLKLSNVFELFPALVKRHKSQIDSYCKQQNFRKALKEEQLTVLLNFMSSLKGS